MDELISNTHHGEFYNDGCPDYSKLLRKGINPFPRLSLDESRMLAYFMSGVSLTNEEWAESSRLQRKACGMVDEEAE